MTKHNRIISTSPHMYELRKNPRAFSKKNWSAYSHIKEPQMPHMSELRKHRHALRAFTGRSNEEIPSAHGFSKSPSKTISKRRWINKQPHMEELRKKTGFKSPLGRANSLRNNQRKKREASMPTLGETGFEPDIMHHHYKRRDAKFDALGSLQ